MPAEQTAGATKSLIFISHSSKDKIIADAICARLENQGIRCWIAPRDVNPGRDYSDQIAEALEKSAVMVMVLSSGSNRSRHVKSEIDRAFSLGHIIVPFRVENIELDKGLAYYLSRTHWLDAVTPPLEQHIDQLAATIRKLSDQDPLPASQAQAPALPVRPVSQPALDKRLLLILLGIGGLVAIMGVAGFIFLMPPHQNLTPRSSETSASPAKDSIAGAWSITEAKTLQGSPYGGTVQFFKQGAHYQVAWQTAAGNYTGVGLVRGNNLCVGWGERSFGVVYYKIEGDGTLNGSWTISGAAIDQVDGSEKAIGGTPGKIEGEYSIAGSNPGSQTRYGGKLKITRTGDTYLMQWTVDDSLTTGVAVKIGDELFAVWGSKDHPYGLVGYTFEGERAKGIWTLGGATRSGTEDLVKQ